MLVLFETPAGYAIFKLLNEKKLSQVDDLFKDFETPELASKIVKLKHFKKFEDTTEALSAVTASIEGKMSKSLKKIMKKVASKEMHEELAVADAKIGNLIKDKFDINCVCSTAVNELMRGIRTQMNGLITGITDKEFTAMSLGLAHSLSRYKLKFSPDKVDTMIVQAISLLDDLDKELNNYIMRCREWYGWHFPELGKIVTDNLAYAKTVKAIGFKVKTASTDLSSILPEDVEDEVKAAAEISMGTDISDEDIENIKFLCDQIIQIAEYRMSLYDYLKNRMQAIAPNLTIMVGELVGARLIAHAGSLLNLAKQPASTVQILGAEKALFRALKTKHDTPKYGLIYHATLVGQSNVKLKGKISRMLASKTALAIRYDALGEDINSDMGIENRAKLESRLKFLEDGGMTRISGSAKGVKHKKVEVISEPIPVYDNNNDSTLKRKIKTEVKVEEIEEETPKKKKKKKDKKVVSENEEIVEEVKVEKKKKKKKSKVESD
ncbi:nucleolar protein 58 isoform X2 [Hydra vulgaris]|uniref:Nucleolar protein 58 isoform X2 n=1 Tax=Hydra vulgaris TaxID=6087 RepID=A0ABM4C1P4_HYDVU